MEVFESKPDVTTRDSLALWAYIDKLEAALRQENTARVRAEDREFQMRRQRDTARQDADDRIAGALA